MKHIIFSLLLLTFFSGCTNPPHIREAYRVMDSFSEKMKKEGYLPVQSGGAMMDDIQIINLGYEIKRSVNIDQARLIILSKSKLLIDLVNKDERIRSYLRNYPFSLENVDLSIMFIQETGDFVNPPFIAVAYTSASKNKIAYTNEDSINNRLITIHEETFEDALKIYNNHKHNNPNMKP